MNWLQKIAGVTFSISGSEKISQPKTLSHISRDMNAWVYDNVPRSLQPSDTSIDADGLNEKFTGTINWYVDKKTDPNEINDIPMYANQYIREHLLPLGIVAKIRPSIEQSNAFRNWLVWRIDVTKNDTTSFRQLPSRGVTQQKAGILLSALGLYEEDNPMGSISAQEFLDRVKSARATIGNYAQPEKIETNYYNAGSSSDNLHETLDDLERMANFAVQHGMQSIQWN